MKVLIETLWLVFAFDTSYTKSHARIKGFKQQNGTREGNGAAFTFLCNGITFANPKIGFTKKVIEIRLYAHVISSTNCTKTVCLCS